MATRHLFSERELTALRGFGEPLRQDLIRFYTLSSSDLDFVAGRRGEANRLGAAVQLCTLRWLGFVPDDVASAPTVVVERLAGQVGVPPDAIVDYGLRSQTRTEHLVEVLACWPTRGLSTVATRLVGTSSGRGDIKGGVRVGVVSPL